MQYRSPFSSEHKIIPAAEACCCRMAPTECCPDLSGDLLLTITSAPAGCDCEGRSKVLEDWGGQWYGTMTQDGNCGPFALYVACDEQTGKYTVTATDAWTLEKHADSCDPFTITGVPTWVIESDCEGMEIEVTENPLP
jgi:hypothetical protein